MNINGAFPSTYLKAADLAGRRVQVIMSHVTTEEVGDGHKPILHFQGKDKGLVLNKTNANMIIEIAGTDETDEWAGKAITLYVAKVDFQGKRVDAIRVDYPQSTGGKPVRKPVATDMTDDDSVPF